MVGIYALNTISFKVKLFTTLRSKTGTVTDYIESSTHSERFMGMQGSHVLFLLWCSIQKETCHPTTYLILVSIACFCIKLTGGEFLPPTLCMETLNLCFSRKRTVSGSTASILLQLRTPVYPNLISDFSGSPCLSSQVLVCGFQLERTFAHLQMPGFVHFFLPNSQLGTPSIPAVFGCPDGHIWNT